MMHINTLADSMVLTSEALVIIEATSPHRVLHTSKSFFCLCGQTFAEIQHRPINTLVDLTEKVRQAVLHGERCCSVVSMTDCHTSFHVLLVSEPTYAHTGAATAGYATLRFKLVLSSDEAMVMVLSCPDVDASALFVLPEDQEAGSDVETEVDWDADDSRLQGNATEDGTHDSCAAVGDLVICAGPSEDGDSETGETDYIETLTSCSSNLVRI